METMALGNQQKNRFQVLIDSDAFIGQIYPDDAHFERANEILRSLAEKRVQLVTTSMVVAETATVLSHRVGQKLVLAFLSVMKRGNIPIIHIDEALQEIALTIFSDQAKKGTSVTDCANVAVMQRFGMSSIFSFDKIYPKKFGLKLVGS